MKNLSAAAAPETSGEIGTATDSGVATSTPGMTVGVSSASASTAGVFPTFGGYGEIYAIGARRAGRINAASISEDEYRALLRERQQLLDKKLYHTIDRRESNRLEYIRWSLARIEDAQSGEALDVLENLVSQYEQFRHDVETLKSDLSDHMTGQRK